jgi:tetratricopeptide (TPR) repeat protein
MRSLPLLLALFTATAFADSGDAVRYAHLKDQINAATDIAKAKPAMEEAVKIYTQDGDLWWQLGRARLQAKEYDGGIAAYQNALKLGAQGNKFKASVYYDLACAYSLKGDTEKGFAFLSQSLNSGFRDLQHLREDSDLKALHEDKRWEELAAAKDVAKMSRDEGWRYDLWLLNREVGRIHINPYTSHSKAEQDAWVRRLNADIPKMTDHQIQVAFMAYMRRVNDGHSHIRPNHATPNAILPIQLASFEEGMMVTAADPSLKDLVGAKLVKLAGHPIDAVMAKLNDIIPQDNTQTFLARAPIYLRIPAMLHGLGLMADTDEIELGVLDTLGAARTVKVKAMVNPDPSKWIACRDTSEAASPLTLKHRDKPYWFESLPGQKAIYMQYNAVRNDPAEDTAHFAHRLFDTIDKADVDTLIVDVRWNGGGNSFLNLPIENGIISCKKIQAGGHLFVITGRDTFSAAQNFTTDLGRACNPIYVGEPTGSSPNFVGESVAFTLPYSKMEGSISDLYWQRSWPMDARTWIAPDLPAPPRFDLYKANRDPAMEAVMVYLRA